VKKGFTIIEVLTAALLLAMVVVMLTMVFNQSSTAWRTGMANVADLDAVRYRVAAYQNEACDALPGLREGARYRVVPSAWYDNDALHARGFCRASEVGGVHLPGQVEYDKARTWSGLAARGASTKGISGFTVGVTSAGPDSTFGTADDITSWPGELK